VGLLLCALAIRSWILFGAFAVMLILNAAQWLYYRYFITRSKVDELDEMTGWEFERWLRGGSERSPSACHPSARRAFGQVLCPPGLSSATRPPTRRVPLPLRRR
jgi:hypothetical protein